MRQTLVLFDFDGTLTKRDTFLQFIFFSHGYLRGAIGFIIYSPIIFLFLVGLIDGSKLKEKLISYYFKGESENVLKLMGTEFIKDLKKRDEFNEPLLQKMISYKAKGNTVGLVSASLDIWLIPFCEQNNVDCLCTEIEFIDGICTGKLLTANCNREEKALRIKKRYILSEYPKIIAYGNSKGDQAMFDLANETHMIR